MDFVINLIKGAVLSLLIFNNTTFATHLHIDEDIWVLKGNGIEINRSNLGRVANIGVINTDFGILVVNTGISHNHALEVIQEALKHKSTQVAGAIILRGEPKYALGAYTFEQNNIRTYAHGATAVRMRKDCAGCIKDLESLLGPAEMSGTGIGLPYPLDELKSKLTNINIRYPGPTVAKGAVVLFNENTETLFAGDIVFDSIIPSTKGSNLTNWVKFLKQLKHERIKTIVPGVGKLLDKAAIDTSIDYLEKLNAITTKLYQDNYDLMSAIDKGSIEEFEGWFLYNERHFNNVMYQYLELERIDLEHNKNY